MPMQRQTRACGQTAAAATEAQTAAHHGATTDMGAAAAETAAAAAESGSGRRGGGGMTVTVSIRFENTERVGTPETTATAADPQQTEATASGDLGTTCATACAARVATPQAAVAGTESCKWRVCVTPQERRRHKCLIAAHVHFMMRPHARVTWVHHHDWRGRSGTPSRRFTALCCHHRLSQSVPICMSVAANESVLATRGLSPPNLPHAMFLGDL